VLFSHPALTAFINEHFEAAWMSVAPVPVITIDFGNGETAKRTLHGNIATYITMADGTTVDVIPGIYDVQPYRNMLQDALGLTKRIAVLPQAQRADAIRAHHGEQMTADSPLFASRFDAPVIDLFTPPLQPSPKPAAGIPEAISKLRIEGSLENSLTNFGAFENGLQLATPQPDKSRGSAAPSALPVNGIDLSRDSTSNELYRRPLVHGLMTNARRLDIFALTRPVYRDVLGVDLSDPYLGLGSILTGGDLLEEFEK
jgi:hypothetical protein